MVVRDAVFFAFWWSGRVWAQKCHSKTDWSFVINSHDFFTTQVSCSLLAVFNTLGIRCEIGSPDDEIAASVEAAVLSYIRYARCPVWMSQQPPLVALAIYSISKFLTDPLVAEGSRAY